MKHTVWTLPYAVVALECQNERSSVRNRLPASALLQARQRARSEQLQYLQGAFEIKAP